MNLHGDNLEPDTGVRDKGGDDKAAVAATAAKLDPDNPTNKAERLEHEIEEIRENLGGLVSELEHRRHRINPVMALRRHPWIATLGGAALVGIVVGALVLQRTRARQQRSWLARSKRLGQTLQAQALQRVQASQGLTGKPDPVARPTPSIPSRMLSAAGTAVAAVVARRLATRLFARSSS